MKFTLNIQERIQLHTTLTSLKAALVAKLGKQQIAELKAEYGLDLRCRKNWEWLMAVTY